jgi:predicted lipoprotein
MRLVIALLLALSAQPVLAQAPVTVTVAAPATVAAQHPAPQATAALQAAVNSVIRPAMVDFKNRSSGLASAMTALCTVPSPGALMIAKGQFRQTALAYGRVEPIRIGPLMEDNRAERVLFWPDRRGIALRQVQAILADSDETATDPATLRDKSVAVQGLGALEYVLFGTDALVLQGPEGAFRCRYGKAIATSIARVAQELAVGWYDPDGIAQHLTSPNPANTDYRTETEALEELVGILSHGVEAARDQRLKPFLAQGDTAAKPKQALFWRSGLTVPMLRANLESLRDLLLRSGVGKLVGTKDIGLENSIGFEFRNASRALDLVTLPVEAAVEDEKQAFALNYLLLVTQSLQGMIGEQLSGAMGLSVGFSALDGDGG